MSGSTGYTYDQGGQVVPTQSLAYLVAQLKAAQAAQAAAAQNQAAAAQNQAAQAPAAGGGTQTAPQTTQAAGAPPAATGGGASPAGAVAPQPAAPTTPQMTPEQQTKLIENYLMNTAYPNIGQQVMNQYQASVEGGPGTAGILHSTPSMGPAGLPFHALSSASPFLSLAGFGLGPVGPMLAAFNALGMLYGQKAPTLTSTDFPWEGGSKGYPTGAGGLGSLVSLPNPSTGYGGATEQLAQQLGGGLSEAYPWGAGAPYTPGSGIYQFAPQMLPQDMPGFATNPAGNPSFFMPGSTPNTFFATDYFGNVTSGPHPMQAGVSTTGSTPLGFGAAEPEWLQQAFGQAGTNIGWAPGGQSDVGWAPAWGTQPTTQQLSGWGITSTAPDRSGGGQ